MTTMSAFITARKGFCYLTVRYGRRTFDMMRIRNYTLEADEKRHMRRLYPDVIFDWKKIAVQLAEKREACRRYRSRRRNPDASRPSAAHESFYGIFEPRTRTVYVSEVPSSAAGAGALLDAVLFIDATLKDAPSPLTDPAELRGLAKPALALVKDNGHPKPR